MTVRARTVEALSLAPGDRMLIGVVSETARMRTVEGLGEVVDVTIVLADTGETMTHTYLADQRLRIVRGEP